MKRYRTSILATAVVALTILSGVLHGRLTRRWGGISQLADAAKELGNVPDHFGNWQLQDSQPLDKTAITQLECAGYLNHIYINQQTGESISIAVIVGPTGPTSVHIPEVCLSSRNYEARDQRRRIPIITEASTTSELWCVNFRSPSVSADELRIYYGWNCGDGWVAPSEPRISMAGYPYLYKLQLSCDMPLGSETTQKDVGVKFLKEFIPLLDDYIVKP